MSKTAQDLFNIFYTPMLDRLFGTYCFGADLKLSDTLQILKSIKDIEENPTLSNKNYEFERKRFFEEYPHLNLDSIKLLTEDTFKGIAKFDKGIEELLKTRVTNAYQDFIINGKSSTMELSLKNKAIKTAIGCLAASNGINPGLLPNKFEAKLKFKPDSITIDINSERYKYIYNAVGHEDGKLEHDQNSGKTIRTIHGRPYISRSIADINYAEPKKSR